MPEPLELTEEEWEQIKVLCARTRGAHYIDLCVRRNGQDQRSEADGLRDLPDFLLRLEAGREQAEHETNRNKTWHGSWCSSCDKTPADWLAAVRKERIGEYDPK